MTGVAEAGIGRHDRDLGNIGQLPPLSCSCPNAAAGAPASNGRASMVIPHPGSLRASRIRTSLRTYADRRPRPLTVYARRTDQSLGAALTSPLTGQFSRCTRGRRAASAPPATREGSANVRDVGLGCPRAPIGNDSTEEATNVQTV